MKKIFLIIGTVLIFTHSTYASDYLLLSDARKFSSDYQQEVTQKKEKESIWNLTGNFKTGLATYEESEQTIYSEADLIFFETVLGAVNRNTNDIEKAINFSFGQTTTGEETWHVSGVKYQTNDLAFSRINLSASIGKMLYSDKYKNLLVIPFLGYGYRYINFERGDFNILNLVTTREVVTEQYYIHHLDVGLKLESTINDKWAINGSCAFGYALKNDADNSRLGEVSGSGGYILDIDAGLTYKLRDSLKFKFGAFFGVQNLNGGEENNIIWPDNELNIYGADIGLQFIF